ncbi:MAG: ribonuclease HI [Ruminococcaceae bacterium]|nr:ribonuclease HI [Oscillospiraceae bacterium]
MKLKHVDVYTDGACSGNPGKGGYGVILKYNGAVKELSEGFVNTTNNRMEILAAVKGLEILKEPCSVTLYSDSKYLVDSVNQGWIIKWQKNNWYRTKNEKAKNVDLFKRLLAQLDIHKVQFVWIKGHAGHPENERCDFLATSAAAGDNLSEDIQEDF